MGLANWLTVLRILLIPVFISLLVYRKPGPALVVFVAAALTDLLDGYVARRHGLSSRLGAFLDPMADKLLLVSSFVTLTWLKALPFWIAAVVISRDLILMALGSGTYDRLARKMGVRVASEGFADRAYNVDLTLVSRKLPGSLITDPQKAAAQAVKMAMESKVRTIDGVEIDISVQTICCHGDTPGAQNIVRAVREALDRAGCQVKPLRDWLPKA